MDNFLAIPMDVDSNSAPTPENPLLNHLILTKVLKNLDTLDLVKCSRVNKLWLIEGRKYLKARRCYVYCRDDGACEDLKQVDESMEKMTDPAEFVYNGLYIPFDCYWHGKGAPGSMCLKYFDEKAGCDKPENISYNNILKKFPLKYLKINWYGGQPLPNCPAALVIPKLLLHRGQTLEEIELVDGPYWLDWLYNHNDLQKGKLWLPKLKLIKGKPMEDHAFSPEVWGLVCVAPNLEDLLVCVKSKDLRKGLAPSDRYNIIKSLCFECLTNYDVLAYSKFVVTEPKLRFLVVKFSFYACMNTDEDSSSDGSDYDDGDDLDMDLCWEVFQRLLKSSQESLEMIQLPVRVLATQFGSDWHVFPNVKELFLEIPLKQQHPEELYVHKVVRHFDFRTKFPNLKSVTLDDKVRRGQDETEDNDNDFVNSVDQLPMLPLVYTAKISRLTLKNHVTDFGLTYSSSVFAHVTELDLSIWGSDIPIPYGTIWREFPQLEMLSAREGFWGQCVNYDAEFLGIFQAEAERLQYSDEEDVKDYQFVPIKPCITTTKNLRQVTVNFMENHMYSGYGDVFFLSPAACILTVQRMPQLKFKLICSSVHEGVMALQNYVEVEDR